MRLFRFGAPGAEKPGVVLAGTHIDVSAFGEDYTEQFFATDGLKRLNAWLAERVETLEPMSDIGRFGAPVTRPSKIVCIGLNYIDHVRETNAAVPQEPVVFFKASTALCGPNDEVVIPRNSVKTDWEVELALVIGRKASYVEEAEAMDYVAGYCLHNDLSEREFQLERGGQWDKGKSCDTFAPIGPYLVTPDEIPDVDNLKMWLKVNDKTVQNSDTSNLIFKIPFLIHYLSQFMTLLPGDIISTGTPPGVGLGMNPPTYLRPGDVMELGIEHLGEARQVCKAWKA